MNISNKELYNYSKSLNILKSMIKKLDDTHVRRFSSLIDTSERGMECSFAKATKNLIPSESAEFLSILNDLKEAVEYFEKVYLEEIDVKEKK